MCEQESFSKPLYMVKNNSKKPQGENFKLYEREALKSMATHTQWKDVPLKARKEIVKRLWAHLNTNIQVKGSGIEVDVPTQEEGSDAPVQQRKRAQKDATEGLITSVEKAVRIGKTAKATWDLLNDVLPVVLKVGSTAKKYLA
jgi:hypothetical protein